MRILALLLIAKVFGSALAAQPQDSSRTIARSGSVEISRIAIMRERASGAVPNADLTRMQIDLWLTEPHLGGEPPAYLVALSELQPIEDDTGKMLLTNERRSALGMLRGEERARSTSTTRGEVGPYIAIVLDAPSRRAETIKRLRGVARLVGTRYERCIWKAIKAEGEQELQHAALKGLHITPSLRLRNGNTVLTLTGVKSNGRVMEYQWGLIKGDQMLEWQSEGHSEDGTVWTKEYEGDQRVGVGLMLTVGQAGEAKVLAFDFQDIALP